MRFGVVKLRCENPQRAKSTPPVFLLVCLAKNTILFQTDLCPKKGMSVRMEKKEKTKKINIILYLFAGILIISIILFGIFFTNYTKNINKLYGEIKNQEIAQIDNKETEETTTNIGKTVEELENEVEIIDIKPEEEIIQNNKPEEKKEDKEITIPDPTFIMPVSGEIITEYAKDNLIYSKTLEEWVTHTGIDIEGETSAIVKAAADGTITAIKNDPRFGTTIIISHDNGYETRYANLLTTEFVKVGEKVSQGQTIGTIGNSAVFEIMEKPHLHFELLKNNEYQNPNLFIK